MENIGKKVIRKTFLKYLSLILIMMICINCLNISVSAEETETENQRKVNIYVVSITGNELTYYEIKEEEAEEDTDTSEETSDESKEESIEEAKRDIPEEMAQRGMPSGEVPSGEVPSGEVPSGEMPSGEMTSGGMPGNFGEADFDMENMPEEGERMGSSRGREFGMQMETVTKYLPVAIVVHTDTEEEMTFSILEAGDELEVLIEINEDGEEIITEIWMTDVEEDSE